MKKLNNAFKLFTGKSLLKQLLYNILSALAGSTVLIVILELFVTQEFNPSRIGVFICIFSAFCIPTVLLRMYNLRTPQNAGKFFFSMPRVEYWFRHMIIATNGLCAVSGAILGTASAVLCNDINVGIICFSAILFQAGILNLLGYANMRILISRI